MGSLIQELAETRLLKDVPTAVIERIHAQARPIALTSGEVLLSPECENDYIYLLLSGSLSVHFDTTDEIDERVLEKGCSVGEMSILDNALPSAYVVVREPAEVFPIHRDLFHQLISECNPFVCNLLKILTQWIKASTECIVRDRSRIGELTNHATTDVLTGLYNRRWLNNAFTRFLVQANETGYPLCVLLIDVDHFKQYNDTFGHLAGDQALIVIGNCLKTTMRSCDFATRFGGEEFLILLPNTTKEEAVKVAERIRHDIENKVVDCLDGTFLPSVTISIGLVTNTPDSTPKSLIDSADAMLYQAKQDGRNCVRY